MSPRVLYTDIDGTLVGPGGNLLADSDGEPSDVAVAALLRAKAAGLEIVGLSGRAQLRMFELARLVGMRSWICELGGVRIYERGDETVLDTGAYDGSIPLPEALAEARTALENHFDTLEEHDPWNEGREVSVMVRGDCDVSEAERLLAEEGFGWAGVTDNGVLPRSVPTLPDVERVRIYHVAPRGLSKRNGIVADQRHRGLDPNDCAVVGDAASDLECAEVVGRCFIVANALRKDPQLAERVGDVPNVTVTARGHGSGFAEAVDTLIAAPDE
ncbi:MAG: HAD hydrolase family protein [Acidimicrobiia bacterium]|nr:HAD hydrolase family protein [Acidimicrobiia bacterium]